MTHVTNDDPLDPWLAELVREAYPDPVVPRELMWARIQRARRGEAGTPAAAPRRPRRWWRSRPLALVVGLAATLVVGIGIGRTIGPSAPAPAVLGPVADGGDFGRGAPAAVAVIEHLARTEALLATVRVEDPATGPGAELVAWARDLLGTTRLLLDLPDLRDERTRALLQDLELVLLQLIQSRGDVAPEVRKAPGETLRDTNLLPRVRAAVTASTTPDDAALRGLAE